MVVLNDGTGFKAFSKVIFARPFYGKDGRYETKSLSLPDSIRQTIEPIVRMAMNYGVPFVSNLL